MKDFRKLAVWEKAHKLTLRIYALTAAYEAYGLTSPLRRSGASVPANISEGCGRDGDAELARFLRIAMGSASELEYHLLLASDLEYLQAGDYESLSADVVTVKRMLAGLIQRLEAES